ncbi:MAG: hypothetical protein K6G36_00440 [Candidatus Saccharibacteria bacterium]|nr:hypothetical protein [Candidatus Saccharibacteria bacterium]
MFEMYDTIERLDIDGGILYIRILVFAGCLLVAIGLLIATLLYGRWLDQDDDAIMEDNRSILKKMLDWVQLAPDSLLVAIVLLLIAGFVGLFNYLSTLTLCAGYVLGAMLGATVGMFDDDSILLNCFLFLCVFLGIACVIPMPALAFGLFPGLTTVLGCALCCVLVAKSMSSPDILIS